MAPIWYGGGVKEWFIKKSRAGIVVNPVYESSLMAKTCFQRKTWLTYLYLDTDLGLKGHFICSGKM
jgi:hypothetical protein